MVDDIFDNSRRPLGRVEVRTGVGRRRRWTEEQKGRIVAESYRAGAVVSEVARRYEISPQHLFGWRKAARAGLDNWPQRFGARVVPSAVGNRFVPSEHVGSDRGILPAIK